MHGFMKIGFLARDQEAHEYPYERLRQAGEKRGHEFFFLDPQKILAIIRSGQLQLLNADHSPFPFVDAVIPRVSCSVALMKQFESLGVSLLNSSAAADLARDKFSSLEKLNAEGIPVPRTVFSYGDIDVENCIDAIGPPPIVIKLKDGTQGIGVMLAESKASLKSTIQTFVELEASFLMQEYIEEARGKDIRCFVIGDQVVGSMQRMATSEYEFRANVSLGAVAEKIAITEEEENMAIQAAKIIGLNVAGVDILRSNRGPLVLEVNAAPGFEGLESATKLDISTMIIEFLEKNVALA